MRARTHIYNVRPHTTLYYNSLRLVCKAFFPNKRKKKNLSAREKKEIYADTARVFLVQLDHGMPLLQKTPAKASVKS